MVVLRQNVDGKFPSKSSRPHIPLRSTGAGVLAGQRVVAPWHSTEVKRIDHGCAHLVGSRTCRNCGKLCAAEDPDSESRRFMISWGDSGKNMRSWAQKIEGRIVLRLPRKCEFVF